MTKLNFKHFGKGQNLIVIHGLYGSSGNWLSFARSLMDDFSIFLVDMRNHGNSPHLKEHNYDVMANDLLEFMDFHNIPSSFILGHSMGGKVAMLFSALHPKRVEKLIVVDISPRTYSLSLGGKTDHLNILKAMLGVNLSEIEKREDANIQMAKFISSERTRMFLLKNLHRNKENKFCWKINLDVINASLSDVLKGIEDKKEALELFTKPTLFIKGGMSEYIQEIDERLIFELFKNVKIKTIKEASHWIHVEKPKEFNRIVKSFILQ